MMMMMEHAYFSNISSKTSDFGCGFWMLSFPAFAQVLLLFLMILWGMKVVLLGGCSCKGLFRFLDDSRGKSALLRNVYCLGFHVAVLCSLRIASCKICLSRFSKNSSSTELDILGANSKKLMKGSSSNDSKSNEHLKENDDDDDDDDDDDKGEKEEEANYDFKNDEEMDLKALKKALWIERKQRTTAYLELEKERVAAASAADEAMAMILRLQNEKSSIQMQADHYCKLAEQKQIHDKEMIQFLQWIILKYESERSILESQLDFYKQKLKNYLKPGEGEEIEFEGIDQTLDSSHHPSMGNDLADGLISFFDMDSAFM